jgi:hypothetical protein
MTKFIPSKKNLSLLVLGDIILSFFIFDAAMDIVYNFGYSQPMHIHAREAK